MVRAIKNDAYAGFAFGHPLAEIKSLLNLNFLSFDCVFAARVCNEAPHELAELGHLCAEGEQIVLDSLPDSMYVIVANDLLAAK